MHRVEFTIEPFVEGDPGPHVLEAVDAARHAGGVDVEFGPFGTTCQVSTERLPDLVAAIVGAARSHGASHVNLDVTIADRDDTGPGTPS